MKTLTDLMNKKTDVQITSLIDVVFLLLVYFMVTSSLVKKEADLSFALPTTSPSLPEYALDVLVEVSGSGQVLIEGAACGDQEQLIQRLAALKTAADSSRSELIVTVLPADRATHGDIVPVMDACAAANVKNLSFAL